MPHALIEVELAKDCWKQYTVIKNEMLLGKSRGADGGKEALFWEKISLFWLLEIGTTQYSTGTGMR